MQLLLAACELTAPLMQKKDVRGQRKSKNQVKIRFKFERQKIDNHLIIITRRTRLILAAHSLPIACRRACATQSTCMHTP